MASPPDMDQLLQQAESLTAELSGPAASKSRSSPARSPGDSRLKRRPELRRLLNLEVPVIVQLGDTNMKLQEVMDLNVGSIIELDKHFDAELELIVGDRQIGVGRAVIVGENFGLRVSRIGTIYDTIRALGS